jgi:DNA-binding transcriptional LysR family regulator
MTLLLRPSEATQSRTSIEEAPAARAATAIPAHRLTRSAVDLNLLIVFDAVMQERSLTRAGRRLGLSQPATSHALARLRTMLGDALFVRTPEGMQPTPRAQQMADPVREALRAINLTLEPEAFDPGAARRSFAIAVNNYGARAVVPALVQRVAKEAPGISLDIRPVGLLDVLDQLDRGSVELALTTLVDGSERFKCVRIMDDDYAVVLDRRHPAADGILTAKRLASIPHLVISSSGDDTGFIDEALEQRGLERRVATRVPLLSVALLLVGSDRIAVLPRRVAADLARICPLVERDLPFPSPRIAMQMIWHRRLDNHPAQRWLREMVRASIRAA